jgi:hypothetical protein
MCLIKCSACGPDTISGALKSDSPGAAWSDESVIYNFVPRNGSMKTSRKDWINNHEKYGVSKNANALWIN